MLKAKLCSAQIITQNENKKLKKKQTKNENIVIQLLSLAVE
jgi:hypothetical protein